MQHIHNTVPLPVFSYSRMAYKHLTGSAGEEPLLEESRCFSVIHGAGGREVLDLVASSEEERDAWVSGLKYLVQSVKVLHEERQYDV